MSINDPFVIKIIAGTAVIVAALFIAIFWVTRSYGQSTLQRYVKIYNSMSRYRHDVITNLQDNRHRQGSEEYNQIRRELYRITMSMDSIRKKVKRTWNVDLPSPTKTDLNP